MVATIELDKTTPAATPILESAKLLKTKIDRIQNQLGVLAKCDQAAQDKVTAAQAALTTETDPGKRMALHTSAALAKEEIAASAIVRATVDGDLSGLSANVAKSIIAWLDTEALAVLDDAFQQRRQEVEDAQRLLAQAEFSLGNAHDLKARATQLCRAVDEAYAGVGASNGPAWAAGVVDDMWASVTQVVAEVAALSKGKEVTK